MFMKIVMFFVLLFATCNSADNCRYNKSIESKLLAVFCGIMTAVLFAVIVRQ